MFMQLVSYMDANNFFNPSHRAYRSFHATTTAMLQMYTTWLDALEQGDMAGVCMIDMSAAFDVVDTNLLLEKLKLYGLDRNALQWVWSYLTYRSQAVYIEGSISGLLPLEAGVPQGSLLDQFCTLFSPLNCHKLYMGRAALSGRWRGDPSLAFSVRNVVGFVAMLMTAHTQWQEMIQKSCQKS